MRRPLAGILFSALTLSALAAPANVPAIGLTQARCPGAESGPVVWKTFRAHVLENLLFAYGSMWVSDQTGGRILRLDPRAVTQGTVAVDSPGGLVVGPDGLIYTGWDDSAADSLLRRGRSKVVRFGPADPAGTMRDYAAGFDMANGLTFAPNGDLFVSNDLGYGPIRIPRANPGAWASFGNVWGTNGLVVDPAAQNLYAAITFDQRSPI